MYLLYLDESGSTPDPEQQYFVLAGVCAFERTTHWIEQKLNGIAERFEPAKFRFHEYGDRDFYDIIRHRFDSDGDADHGLFVGTGPAYPFVSEPAAVYAI